MAKSKPRLPIGFFISSLLLVVWPWASQALIPSDVYYREQSYLPMIKADQAWDVGIGSKNITIAVLDSGVQISHPDLIDNIWVNQDEVSNNGIDDDNNGYVDDSHGWDFVDNVSDPSPKLTGKYSIPAVIHGTMVAGVAAAVGSNAQGIAGVCMRCKIMPLRVLDSAGVGDVGAVISAIDYAVKMKADVLNLSFVGVHGSPALGEALQRAWRAGLVIVAASGNEGEGLGMDMDATPQYPVCLDSTENIIIGVGAVDEDKKLTPFSNYGKRCVDIVAPGTKIVGLQPVFSDKQNFRQPYGGWWAGTSLAAPMVAGAAGLIKSVYPSLTNAQIRDRLLNNAENIALQNPEMYSKMGSGLLNIYDSLVPPQEVSPVFNSYYYPGIVGTWTEKNKTYVKIFDHRGRTLRQFVVFESAMSNVTTAVGDLIGDGSSLIVVAAGKGASPEIRVFDESGELLGKWLAYSKGFRGGVSVAVGDVDGDGIMEVVASPGPGGGPHVRVFDRSGNLLNQFFAYDSKFYGGVSVAAGDVNGDGRDEIITAPGPGGGPHVRVFNNKGASLGGFFAFTKTHRKGLRVAVGVTNVDSGKANILITQASSAESVVRVFDLSGRLDSQFRVYPTSFTGGVNIATGDVNGDGLTEIITAPGTGGGPQVKVFNQSGENLSQFFTTSQKFRGGVNINSK